VTKRPNLRPELKKPFNMAVEVLQMSLRLSGGIVLNVERDHEGNITKFMPLNDPRGAQGKFTLTMIENELPAKQRTDDNIAEVLNECINWWTPSLNLKDAPDISPNALLISKGLN